jgi:hypothetical protein
MADVSKQEYEIDGSTFVVVEIAPNSQMTLAFFPVEEDN